MGCRARIKSGEVHEEEVINWVNQAVHTYRQHFDNRLGIPDVEFDRERWIEEGKKMAGLEAILIDLLEKEDKRVDFTKVIYALGFFGDSNSVPILISNLKNSNLLIRISAAVSLGKIGDKRAIGPLCEVIINDHDENVRANSSITLGKIGDPNAIECLKRVATKDRSAFVRKYAQEAIDELEKTKK